MIGLDFSIPLSKLGERKKRKRKRPSDNAMFKGLFCRRESLKLVKTQASSFPTRRTLLFKRGPLPFSGHILVGKFGYQLPFLTNESVSYWLPYVKNERERRIGFCTDYEFPSHARFELRMCLYCENERHMQGSSQVKNESTMRYLMNKWFHYVYVFVNKDMPIICSLNPQNNYKILKNPHVNSFQRFLFHL